MALRRLDYYKEAKKKQREEQYKEPKLLSWDELGIDGNSD
jgi:hypothetical protein